jgi:hypothetical protein
MVLMLLDINDVDKKQAKFPHDLFLINLIGNHILTFVATLGLATSWAWPMLIVPIVSFVILGIIVRKGLMIRQQTACDTASWYIMCHWQIALQRSLFFIKMIILLSVIAGIGLYGYWYLDWMREAVFALIGGICILPIMVTTLILIIMESDALHQAGEGKLPDNMLVLYPNDQIITIELMDANK